MDDEDCMVGGGGGVLITFVVSCTQSRSSVDDVFLCVGVGTGVGGQ